MDSEPDPFNRICGVCGLTWGAHRGDPSDERCPGHEGRMDWDNGPGTVFLDSGDVAVVERGTPARNLVSR